MKVVIVGGGLVGALEACFMAKRGHQVELYESRKDLRKEPRYSGYSINLALSCRGIEALQHVGLEEQILKDGIPMKARMIHSLEGKLSPIPYGTEGQAIMSVDRRNLNEQLLTAAEQFPNVKTFFQHKLRRINLKTNHLHFEDANKQEVVVSADLILGADGAHSATRRSLLRHERIDYQHFFIPHGYKELCIPAKDGEYQMPTNYLHIWPRSSFMMIALPNPDKSFTVTLFMPFEKFEALKTDEDVLAFFEAEFPDSIPLIGRERLLNDFKHNPTSSLITVKCSKLAGRRCGLLGDAAHAIVPFYGQGMNAGFEDCLVLEDCLNAVPDNMEKALELYSATRVKDVHAIADLALYNYVEMRDLVNSPWFLFRKKIDNALHRLMPSTFIPLYTMVTFTRIPYATVVENNARQKRAVNTSLALLAVGAAVGIGFVVRRALLNK
eukprot:m.8500 g.8500  ORF g.8500 m.8500 type:complete len:440 (-) comp5462_c0_seq1:52-1371(-)